MKEATVMDETIKSKKKQKIQEKYINQSKQH